MSTRGLWGITGIKGRKDNLTEFAVFHSSDSYPQYLGYHILESIRNHDLTDFENFAQKVKVYNDENDIYNRKVEDSYTQPHKTDIKIVNGIDFIKDSLFCEWVYFINLENKTIDIYKGFNTDPTEAGRFASETVDNEKKYYGCRLLIEIPIEQIKQWGNNEIQMFMYNLDYLSTVISMKNYKYLPNDSKVEQSFAETQLIMDMIKPLNQNKKELILYIISEMALLIHNKGQDKVKSDVNFVKSFPSNDMFIHAFQILLDGNPNNVEILKSIDSLSITQLKNVYTNCRKNNIILFNDLFKNVTSDAATSQHFNNPKKR